MSYLPAFIHLQNDLATLKRECSKGYIDGFVELLVEDLRLHFNNVPVKDTLNRIYVNKDKTKKYNPIQLIPLILILMKQLKLLCVNSLVIWPKQDPYHKHIPTTNQNSLLKSKTSLNKIYHYKTDRYVQHFITSIANSKCRASTTKTIKCIKFEYKNINTQRV